MILKDQKGTDIPFRDVFIISTSHSSVNTIFHKKIPSHHDSDWEMFFLFTYCSIFNLETICMDVLSLAAV